MGYYLITITPTSIDADLTDFPVLVVLNSDILSADDLSAVYSDPKKVSFKDANGDDCYAEIESSSSVETRYHVKFPSISSTEDTIIKMILGLDADSSYIGNTGETAAQAVWSNGFKVVYHMTQDPTAGAILDSSPNSNNASTANGSMTSTNLVDTDYGKAIAFDGSDDQIISDSPLGITGAGVRTLTGYILPSTTTINSNDVYLSFGACATNAMTAIGAKGTTGIYSAAFFNNDYSTGQTILNEWALVTVTYDGTTVKFYYKGSLIYSTTVTLVGTDGKFYLASLPRTSNIQAGLVTIAEARVSSVCRSAAWIAATQKSISNTLLSIYKPYKIAGIVTDTQGAPLAATVNLHNQATGALILSTSSDETGKYVFENIFDGDYYVVAFVTGYQALVYNDIAAVEMGL